MHVSTSQSKLREAEAEVEKYLSRLKKKVGIKIKLKLSPFKLGNSRMLTCNTLLGECKILHDEISLIEGKTTTGRC